MAEHLELFPRTWSVEVNDGQQTKIFNHQFHIAFRVLKTGDLAPNECELTLFNLNVTDRNFVGRRNVQIILKAGYEKTSGQIFQGAVELVNQIKNGNTWETRLFCKDGAIARRNITITKSFKKGTPVEKVIEALIKEITLPPEIDSQFKAINQVAKGKIENLPATLYPKTKKETQRGRGKKLTEAQKSAKERQKKARDKQKSENIKLNKQLILRGAAIQKLDILCKSYGLKAIWLDQTIHVVPLDSAIDSEVIALTPLSGLIGSPQTLEKGYRLDSALRHEFNPGHAVDVESRNLSGRLLIQRLEHQGESYGGQWTSNLEAIAV